MRIAIFERSLFLLLFLLPLRVLSGSDDRVDASNAAQIKNMLRDYIEIDKLGVGVVVGTVDEQGARIVSQGKLGDATERDVDGDTLFDIASMSKVFTALLLQDMVERGEMNLDAPVQQYLPASVKLPAFNGKQITLLHLATHTSGLPRDINNMTPVTWRNPMADYKLEQWHAFLSHCKVAQAPGTK